MGHGTISNSSCDVRCACALIGSLRQSSCARLSRRDVVAGAEAAALGAQQDDAGRGIGVGPRERVGQLLLQLRADRIELFRPVEGDDADLVVDLVQHQGIGHACSPPLIDRFLPAGPEKQGGKSIPCRKCTEFDILKDIEKHAGKAPAREPAPFTTADEEVLETLFARLRRVWEQEAATQTQKAQDS